MAEAMETLGRLHLDTFIPAKTGMAQRIVKNLYVQQVLCYHLSPNHCPPNLSHLWWAPGMQKQESIESFNLPQVQTLRA